MSEIQKGHASKARKPYTTPAITDIDGARIETGTNSFTQEILTVYTPYS